MQENLKKAKAAIEAADSVLITAGAGMGVDSGLPDFRGPEGFWRAYPAIRKLGYRFEEMANPEWFDKEPRLAWAFYGHRYLLYSRTRPHEGFSRLLALCGHKKGGCFIFTSNVDGQFQKAGFDEEQIMEVHGSIHWLQCSVNCTDEIWKAEDLGIKIDPETFRLTSEIPSCPRCGGVARPNILMFGDYRWISRRTDLRYERMRIWLEKKSRTKMVIIEIGAGTAVPTVRMMSEKIMRDYNATLIRINPGEYDVPKRAIGLPMGAKEAIERLYAPIAKA
ncbi:MAG: NAD-dependent deacetylase [Campylobacteraceae bacterium 4484_4]|nr:MAG: NAD-dependent deacetylase [Campylobacteraceae bacterium 4484_4]